MGVLDIYSGSHNIILNVFLVNSSTGNGITGLSSVSAGLICYYLNAGDAGVATPTQLMLTATTVGVWVAGGFVEVDSVNMPGLYQLGLPDAALLTGSLLTIVISGAANLTEYATDYQLTATNNQDALRGGLLALPNGPMQLKKNQALAGFPFLMVSKADHTTPLTGLTITSLVSINGLSPVPTQNTATEISAILMPGMYTINLNAADTNGNTLAFAFMSPGADTRIIAAITQP